MARNVKSFEIWSSYQGCEEAALDDAPPDLKADIRSVFDVMQQLPIELVEEVRYSILSCWVYY